MSERAEPGMTISCQEVVELVTDYLEGLVDDGTRVEVEAHLELCPGCDEYLRQMEATIRTLGYVPLDTLPDAAKEDLTAAFRNITRADL